MLRTLSLFVLSLLGWMWGAAHCQVRLHPHLTRTEGGFQSQILLSNGSSQAGEFRLEAFNSAGEQVGIFSGTLPSFSVAQYEPEMLFARTASHFSIDASPLLETTIAYQRLGEGHGRAHVRESQNQSRNWRIFTGNPGVTWDGLAVVNTGTTTTNLLAKSFDASGSLQAGPQVIYPGLAPMAKALVLLGDLFPAPTAYVDIEASEPLALMALRGNLASDFLWENRAAAIPLLETPTTNWYPHLTRPGGGFESTLILSNPTEGNSTYTLSGLDASGNSTQHITGTLLPGQTVFLDAEAALGTETTHGTLNQGASALLYVAYLRTQAGSGPAHVPLKAQSSRLWLLYPDASPQTWDGLALVNPSQLAARVQFWELALNGSVISGPTEISNLLPARGKQLFVLPANSSDATSHFEIEASEPVILLALRGNLASEFLWENTALALPEIQSQTPPARIDYAIAYDPMRRQHIMAGGFDKDFALLQDTWTWNGRFWSALPTSPSILPRSHHAGVWFPEGEGMLVFGGFESQTQRRNDFRLLTADGWQDFPGNPAIPKQDGELIYDSSRKRLMLIIANGSNLEVWEFANDSWTLKPTVTNPGLRLDQGIVYDPIRQRTVMFGGLSTGNRPINETWTYDGTDWTKLSPSTNPPKLLGMAMYYDSQRQCIYLFGGMDEARKLRNQTWRFDGMNWEEVSPIASPSARWVCFASYDPVRGVGILFGGEGGDGFEVLSDTWEFDGASWTQR